MPESSGEMNQDITGTEHNKKKKKESQQMIIRNQKNTLNFNILSSKLFVLHHVFRIMPW